MLTAEDLDVPYDFDSLAKAGSMLGSGAIIVVDDSTPILDVALKVAKFYRHESCGKCTPCREGTNWTVKMLERIDRGEATPMDLEIMASVQEHIIGHCLCVLGDAMAMPIGSMIVEVPRRVRSPHRDPAPGSPSARRGGGMTDPALNKPTARGKTKAVTSEGPRARSATDARRASVPIKRGTGCPADHFQKRPRPCRPKRMKTQISPKTI